MRDSGWRLGLTEAPLTARMRWLGLALTLLTAPVYGHMPGPSRQSEAVTGTAASVAFLRRYIDLDYGGNGRPGWVHPADVDLDGDLDIVAGGGFALFVYENAGRADGWQRHGNLDSTGSMGANGAVVYDVDRDGDPDVVSALYNSDLGWWENPGGAPGPTPWAFHTLSQETRYLHDLIRVDLDRDGKAEEFVANLNQGYWNARITLKWYRPPADPFQLWEQHVIEPDRAEGTPHGHAGLDVADIDDDGDHDLAYANGWYEGPVDPAGSWAWHQVTDEYGISNALIRDMNENGAPDLLVSAGHHGDGVFWFERPPDPVNDPWPRHEVDPALHHPECLQTVDVSGDADLDVVTCDLFFGEEPGEPDWSDEAHNIYLYENLPGPDGWAASTLSPNSYPSHLLKLVDLNEDGRWDILSESAGTSVISYYENASGTRHFELEVVDAAYPGNGRPGWSAAGDVDGNGQVDVVAGGGSAIQWYRAPDWTRFPLESPSTAGGNGGVVTDVDGDGDADVISALFESDLVWWENPGPGGVTGPWPRHTIDPTVSHYNHDLELSDLDGDSSLEVVALYVDGEVRWYDVPADPTSSPWPRTRILALIQDPYVGLAACDLDGDGDQDVVASSSWYENPTDPGTPDWTSRPLFGQAVQNVACHDVNGDSRHDVVGAQGFVNPAGRIYWAESPPDPRGDPWTERVVAQDLDGPENLWVGDLDGDGFTDVLSGEMGTSNGFGDNDSNVALFLGRNADGLAWERRDLGWGVGVSARLKETDIDGDGDPDFTADGNAEGHIYLWRNVEAALFADGFESGDTSAWGVTVP